MMIMPNAAVSPTMTSKQERYIQSLYKQVLGISAETPELKADVYGVNAQTTKKEASQIINSLKTALGMPVQSAGTAAPATPAPSADEFDELFAEDDDDAEDDTPAAPTVDPVAAQAEAARREIMASMMDGRPADADQLLAGLITAANKPAQVIVQGNTEAPGLVDVNPQGSRTARELWPDLPPSAASIHFPVFDHVPQIPVDNDYSMQALYRSHGLAMAAVAMQEGQHIWLGGHRGTGKSQFVHHLAKATGRPLFSIAVDPTLEPHDVIGGRTGLDPATGEGIWTPGSLIIAMQQPNAILLVDEPSTNPHVTSILQVVMSAGYYTVAETGETYFVAPGVTIIAADNTFGSGDDSQQYDTTQTLSGALTDRFAAMIEFDYPTPAAESALLAKVTGAPSDICDKVAALAGVLRDQLRAGDIMTPISFRRCRALATMLAAGVNGRAAYESTVLRYVASEQDRETFRQVGNANL